MGFKSTMGDILGNIPIIGGFFGDSTEDKSRQQQQRYQQLHDQYMAQLEPTRAARMQALQQSMSLFQPMNEMMQRQYGYDYDFGNLIRDPMEGFEEAVAANMPENQPAAEYIRNMPVFGGMVSTQSNKVPGFDERLKQIPTFWDRKNKENK